MPNLHRVQRLDKTVSVALCRVARCELGFGKRHNVRYRSDFQLYSSVGYVDESSLALQVSE